MCVQVLCVGQIVGAVVAGSREQAKRAAKKVQITYQDLQPVFFTIEVPQSKPLALNQVQGIGKIHFTKVLGNGCLVLSPRMP